MVSREYCLQVKVTITNSSLGVEIREATSERCEFWSWAQSINFYLSLNGETPQSEPNTLVSQYPRTCSPEFQATFEIKSFIIRGPAIRYLVQGLHIFNGRPPTKNKNRGTYPISYLHKQKKISKSIEFAEFVKPNFTGWDFMAQFS